MRRHSRIIDPLRWAEARHIVGTIIHADFQADEAIGLGVIGLYVDAFVHCDCKGATSAQARNRCNHGDDCRAYRIGEGYSDMMNSGLIETGIE